MHIREIILVATGGAFGAVARHLASVLWTTMLGDRFPWGTLFVNVLGCFLLGWLARSVVLSDAISVSWKLVLGTGFLGAFTTFSTFGVQTVQLWEKSSTAAAMNVASNLLVGIVAVLAGMYLATLMSAAN